jgi:hypothetical protein
MGNRQGAKICIFFFCLYGDGVSDLLVKIDKVHRPDYIVTTVKICIPSTGELFVLPEKELIKGCSKT